MTSRIGGDQIAIIAIAVSCVIITILLVLNWSESRQMQMKAFEMCLENNLNIQKENKSSFPVANYCRF